MVGENFEIFMSEMPENVANCQKSDFPPGQNLKIQIPPKNPFSPGTSPQTEPFGKSWFLTKILERNDTMWNNCMWELTYEVFGIKVDFWSTYYWVFLSFCGLHIFGLW